MLRKKISTQNVLKEDVKAEEASNTTSANSKMFVFGRHPGRQVAVDLNLGDDPKEMMEGMEEYFFKQTQSMQFGPNKDPQENIYKAVLVEDSTNYRIFKHNLDVKIKVEGVKPIDQDAK